MIEPLKKFLLGQYGAALAVLKQCVQKCPQDAWERNVGNHAFWHVAYHALFYTDLYLSPDERSFTPPTFYREDYQFFGRKPWPPHEPVVADVPYPKDVILGYVETCRQKAADIMVAETVESLQGPSGFSWYPVPRTEMHLINIRHVQHHAAQMSLALRKVAGIGIEWVATG